MQLLAVMKSGKIGKFQRSLREDVHKCGQISSPDRVYIDIQYVTYLIDRFMIGHLCSNKCKAIRLTVNH